MTSALGRRGRSHCLVIGPWEPPKDSHEVGHIVVFGAHRACLGVPHNFVSLESVRFPFLSAYVMAILI